MCGQNIALKITFSLIFAGALAGASWGQRSRLSKFGSFKNKSSKQKDFLFSAVNMLCKLIIMIMYS